MFFRADDVEARGGGAGSGGGGGEPGEGRHDVGLGWIGILQGAYEEADLGPVYAFSAGGGGLGED